MTNGTGCPRTEEFFRMWDFFFFWLKTENAQANQKELATLPGTLARTLLPGFSKTLGGHNEFFLLSLLDSEDKEKHNKCAMESYGP